MMKLDVWLALTLAIYPLGGNLLRMLHNDYHNLLYNSLYEHDPISRSHTQGCEIEQRPATYP